jgi:hypothetical protein
MKVASTTIVPQIELDAIDRSRVHKPAVLERKTAGGPMIWAIVRL